MKIGYEPEIRGMRMGSNTVFEVCYLRRERPIEAQSPRSSNQQLNEGICQGYSKPSHPFGQR